MMGNYPPQREGSTAAKSTGDKGRSSSRAGVCSVLGSKRVFRSVCLHSGADEGLPATSKVSHGRTRMARLKMHGAWRTCAEAVASRWTWSREEVRVFGEKASRSAEVLRGAESNG